MLRRPVGGIRDHRLKGGAIGGKLHAELARDAVVCGGGVIQPRPDNRRRVSGISGGDTGEANIGTRDSRQGNGDRSAEQKARHGELRQMEGGSLREIYWDWINRWDFRSTVCSRGC